MEVDHSLDGESRVAEVYAILSVGCVLTITVVGLRMYTRIRLLNSFGADDAMMMVALVLAIGTTIAIGLECKYGLGKHTWVQPKEYAIPYMKAFYSSIIIYNVALCIAKISILLQYRRIFTGTIIHQITTYAIGFLCAWTVTIAFLLSLICIPVAAFWDSSVKGRCLNSLTVWYVMASFNLVTDILLFIMPMPMIRSLQLPRKQKYTLVIVFSLGLCTCIISIIRLRTLADAGSAKDPNWDNVNAAYWSFLEMCTSIIASCLPTLRPVLSRVMPSLFATRSQMSSGHGYPSGRSTVYGRGSLFRKVTTVKLDDSTTTLHADDEVELTSRDPDGRRLNTSYRVTVEGGGEAHAETASIGPGGIKTTTIVTQEVSHS
ncbi:related to integral membrane protein [Cephalotrichum gorgonifer]|uniref:Related to integral membrane protein n=1 Tax=Cephalotrichum gorgonifer TaxID=2041049 RepID=A0AAE8N0P6_9PEZI|nr:related to integral membrane protein [Cephalotrichum gorgonifer]